MENIDHDRMCKTYWNLWNSTQSDPEYALLRAELEKWETRYEAALASLSLEARTVIETCITLRETMNRRMLEYACEEILHPDEICP